jgi:hypothetical protein
VQLVNTGKLRALPVSQVQAGGRTQNVPTVINASATRRLPLSRHSAQRGYAN